MSNNTKVPTRASRRKVLAAVLRRDAQLQAFCLDHFPVICPQTQPTGAEDGTAE